MDQARGPIITDKTTLSELQESGATTLSDIPLVELLEFVRNTCLSVSGDVEADKEMNWGDDFAEAAEATQRAIEAINRGMHKGV